MIYLSAIIFHFVPVAYSMCCITISIPKSAPSIRLVTLLNNHEKVVYGNIHFVTSVAIAASLSCYMILKASERHHLKGSHFISK